MSDKYLNLYRIQSSRAPWHDYNVGAYFITICTHRRKYYFGRISKNANGDNEMQLSEIGRYTERCLKNITKPKKGISVPIYAIMPDHIHLILISTPPCGDATGVPIVPIAATATDDIENTESICNNNVSPVSTEKNEKMQEIANKCGKASHVISRFKSVVSKYATAHEIPFAWQTRFHDHIIKNTTEMNRISNYIAKNVAAWKIEDH